MEDWIAAFLLQGGDRSGHDLTEDGRLDLRGIEFPTVAEAKAGAFRVDQLTSLAAQGIYVRDQTWSGLDLSGARLEALFFINCRFLGCVFDDANMANTGFSSSRIEQCSFVGTNLRSAGIGNAGTILRDVDFSRASLIDARFTDGDFERCDFTGATLTRVRCINTRFHHCNLSAKLTDIQFYAQKLLTPDPADNLFAHCDLSGADHRRVVWRRVDLSTCQLPEAESSLCFVYDAAAIERAEQDLRQHHGQVGAGAAAYISGYRKWAPEHPAILLMNASDPAPDSDLIIDALTKHCGRIDRQSPVGWWGFRV
ncbi:MAG: pentapeptide repeat-containing protein [Acidimicrobiales bacterium]